MCSIFKTRLATARIVALPGADTTLITIPELRSGWRPGQHVRIRVPAFGLVRGFESHPFTIASAPNGEGLVLMCKKAGDWTTRLNHHAAAGSITETGEKGRHITIILEGPYGGLGNTMISSYSGAMLVAGGSGITSALGHATGLIARAPTGAVRTRTIDLVWLVRTEEIAKPFVKILSDLVDEAKRWEQKCIRAQGGLRPVALRVHVFITRCSIDSPPNLLPYSPSSGSSGGSSSASLEDDKSVRLESGDLNTFTTTSLTMTNGNTSSEVLSSITVKTLRPSFIAVLSGITDETIERGAKEGHSPSGILVTACGPGGMVFTVSESVRLYEEYKKKLVGGVDFEAQHFGW
ncbi:hypothetical protein IAR55_005596 [Kwoniella newhampshirensis]|uniref:ferric-chelate reductase (NADPH) n=1 Tax=Kwoniella newhampshirensis TaxID=1651941 RepID=A0AAW0YV24_9TREE